MPSYKECDFRHDWVSLVFHALESGFTTIQKLGEELPWFDGGWQLEHAESIYGIAFITAQTYISGTVEDVNSIRESAGKERLRKIEYYSDDDCPRVAGVSRILLINSIANYYKHHDEWERTWKDNPTTRTLSSAGINENTKFPCYEAATILCEGNGLEQLKNLLSIVSDWRKNILSKHK